MPWAWSVWGKHPAFKDYISLGAADPLCKGITDWVRNGYAQIKIEQGFRHFFSWRFWMKGIGKENLALGILRDSSDQLGRPYPLLLMGVGSLSDWEKNWDLLPLALEDSWGEMEHLLARSYKTLQELEEKMHQIPSPGEEWERMREKRNLQNNKGLEEEVIKNLNKEAFFISLDQNFQLKPMVLISLYHYFWKKRGASIPTSIFMGGSLAKTFLAFFCRPLLPDDFKDLWSKALMVR